MRHLIALGAAGRSFEEKTVLEFGPGSSLGMGIAALLCGANRYYAFDLVDQTAAERNVMVFDELSELFRGRTPIPMTGWPAHVFPFVDDPAFPSKLLPERLLERSLAQDRLRAIRTDLAENRREFIRAHVSPTPAAAKIGEPVDIIFSESVLEHVDDLEGTYRAFANWLAPNGIMSHLIDYSCHGLSKYWNGHWQCPPRLWFLVRGKRHFLINRAPHERHLELLRANGFEVIQTKLLRRVDGLIPEQFSSEFRAMSLFDATTSMASVVSRRRKN